MMNNLELITDILKKKLIPLKKYTTDEIRKVLFDGGFTIVHDFNITSLTYNRWNSGMEYILPLLEWISFGKYVYLGENYDYKGYVYHFPNDKETSTKSINCIAKWNGVNDFSFINAEIIDIKDWKQNFSTYSGVPCINLNSEFNLKIGNINKKYILSKKDGNNSLDISSKLGQAVLGKVVGYKFKHPNFDDECEIISINY